jgi:tetratricopeptide (TPR) repeat protein
MHHEEAKWSVGLALSLTLLGHTYSFLGNPKTGRRHAEKALQIFRDSGIELWLSYNHFVLGMIHLNLGGLENGGSYMEEALRLSRKNNEKGWEGWSWIGLGKILERREPRQMDKAEECLFKGLEILRELKMEASYSRGHLFLGEFYLDVGEKKRAMENLKKAEGMFQEMGMDYWLTKTQEVLGRL